jgi:hypothetical protein
MAAGTMTQLYAAVGAIIDDIETAVTKTIAAAPTNFGEDFRITSGTAVYQARIVREKDYGADSNLLYPRAIVEIAIHHYAASLADEVSFQNVTMSAASNRFLRDSYWQAEAGVFDLEPGVVPEISDGERVGNVISFVITASVLMDAA